jgi:hypothetical protein
MKSLMFVLAATVDVPRAEGHRGRMSVSAHPPHRTERASFTGEWREGISPSRSLRTVREPLDSYGSHHPVVVRNSAQCAKR